MGFVDCSRKKQYEQCLEEKGLLKFSFGRNPTGWWLGSIFCRLCHGCAGYLPSTAQRSFWDDVETSKKIIISWKNKHWSISMVLLCIRLAPTVSRGHQFRTWSRIYLLHSWHYIPYNTQRYKPLYPSQMLKQEKEHYPQETNSTKQVLQLVHSNLQVPNWTIYRTHFISTNKKNCYPGCFPCTSCRSPTSCATTAAKEACVAEHETNVPEYEGLFSIPRCSMYGTFTYMYHEHCQMKVNIPYIEHLG